MENELLQKVKDDYAASQISNGVEFNNWAEFIDFNSGEPISWFETHVNAIAEAYAAKLEQKHHLVELMKMDEGNPKTNILALMQLGVHIQLMDKHMAEQFMRSDYRSMWEIWRGVADMVNEIEQTLKQKLNGTSNR